MNKTLLFALLLQTGVTSAACLSYEPSMVILTGKLHRATFPGAPNFESVAAGDQPETGYYLTLEQPICTLADKYDDHTPFKSVKEIQLVLNEKQYDELRPRLGQTVQLRGRMFSAFTGHHHADVLMKVVDK